LATGGLCRSISLCILPGPRSSVVDVSKNHKFKVGQAVYYESGFGSRRRSDVFQIIQRLPPENGDYQYRIKNADEPYDRVAKESELETVM
jgi:hypothetical protein